MGKKPAGRSHRSQSVTPLGDAWEERRRLLEALREALVGATAATVPVPTLVEPIRHRPDLPSLGTWARVLAEWDGRPWHPTKVGRVWDRRGGVPRLLIRRNRVTGEVTQRSLPPKLVEYRVGGFGGWWPWYQVERVDQ